MSVLPAQVLKFPGDRVPQVLRFPGKLLLLGRDVYLPLNDAVRQPANDRGGGRGRLTRSPGN
jgi:hypothetical protein